MTFHFPTLGDLANSEKYGEPIATHGVPSDRLLRQLEMMMLIRVTEEVIAEGVTAGIIHCPCHLAIGQEAVAVGVSENLTHTDRVFGGHRSHSHYLAQGGALYGLLAEVLGKESGCSKGMGGSMHLYDKASGFMGSVPIVAATVPLAVGAGLAAKKDNRGAVAVTYFGDGAAEEGVVHESMNFAAAFKLPVLFVCENNLFSSHLHIDLRQPSNSVARFAAAHEIPYQVVDGNDVVAVSEATERLVKRARDGEGPGFLEAVTYRWRGHVGPREDIDVGVQRKSDLPLWKRRDPIRRLAESLETLGAVDADWLERRWSAIRAKVTSVWEEAILAPYPQSSATLSRVYANGQLTGGIQA